MKRREFIKGLILAPLAVKLAPVLEFIPEPIAKHIPYRDLILAEFRKDLDRAFLFGGDPSQPTCSGIRHLVGYDHATTRRMDYEK